MAGLAEVATIEAEELEVTSKNIQAKTQIKTAWPVDDIRRRSRLRCGGIRRYASVEPVPAAG